MKSLTLVSLAILSLALPAWAETSGTSGSTDNQQSNLTHAREGTTDNGYKQSETGIASHADTRADAPGANAPRTPRAGMRKHKVKRMKAPARDAGASTDMPKDPVSGK